MVGQRGVENDDVEHNDVDDGNSASKNGDDGNSRSKGDEYGEYGVFSIPYVVVGL